MKEKGYILGSVASSKKKNKMMVFEKEVIGIVMM